MAKHAGVREALEKMSFQELMHLKGEVELLISSRQEEAKADLRKQMEQVAQSAGLSLKDVFGGRKMPRPAAIKYRDPDNPTNTWTGRGRTPRWLTAYLNKRGVKIEDFLVQS